MVHLLATIANDPEYVPALLFSLAREVRVQAETARGETWGIGYFAEDRGLIVRKPAGLLEARSAFSVARSVKSRVLLACASGEGAATLDPPPYRFRRWLFGYAGPVEPLGVLEDKVAARMPDFVREMLGSGHGGRLAHAMFLTELHRDGLLEDPLADPSKLGSALVRTAQTLTRLAPEAGVAPADVAFVASEGRTLLIAGAGRALHHREVHGLEHLPEGPLDETLHDFKRINESLRRFRAHAVALDVEPGAVGWRELGRFDGFVITNQLQMLPISA